MPGLRDADPSLARIERDALVACAGLAVVALVARRGRLDVALGIVCGGALIAASYLAIKGGVNAIVGAATRSANPDPPSRPALGRGRRLLLIVNFIVRYALLALAAYVMLVRFDVNAVGLVIGAACPVVAVAAEVVRQLRR